MKKSSFLISVALLTTLFSTQFITSSQAEIQTGEGCTIPQSKTTTTPTQVTGDNASTSLDWDGTYQGVLPCASCEGLKTSLTLNKDLSYTLLTEYLGKSKEVFEVKGTFKWNPAGNSITLDGIKDAPNQFFVGENTLIQLDMSGNRISGELANNYTLTKVNKSEANLTGVRWELVEIMGKPVTKSENQREAMFITFDEDNKRVNGFSGCNNFMGGFEMKEGGRITFSQLASTMMACENMDMEVSFMETLRNVDNYAIKDNVLSLNRARMAPLLKFSAVNK